MKVGWLGLGNMGSVMAARVLDAGHELTVYNRSISKAQALVERGARLAKTPAEAAEAAGGGALVSMLADDASLRALLEQGGALAALTPGSVHLSMSTISPALAAELTATHAAHGSSFVGAPVFGRPEAAAAGKLFILAAGEKAALERCQPLFDVLSQKVLPLGATPSAAHLTKVLGNFLLISSVEALAEALNVAHRSDLDVDATLSALTSTVFSAPFYANYGRMILAQSFDGPSAFTLGLARKDVDLARAAATSAGAPLPLADTVRSKLQALIDGGAENVDVTVIGKWT